MEQNESQYAEYIEENVKYGSLRLPKTVLNDLAVWKRAYEQALGWRMTYKTMIRGIFSTHRIPDEVVEKYEELKKGMSANRR